MWIRYFIEIAPTPENPERAADAASCIRFHASYYRAFHADYPFRSGAEAVAAVLSREYDTLFIVRERDYSKVR